MNRVTRTSSSARHLLTSIMLFVVLSLVTGPLPSVSGQVDTPADLAAMTLHPTDLEAAGLTGFLLDAAMYSVDPDDVADWYNALPYDAATDDGMAFSDAAPPRAHANTLYQPLPEDPTLASYTVLSFAFEYGSRRDARDGLTAIAETWLDADTADEQQLRADLGQDQVLVTSTGSNPWEPEEIDRASVVFRQDNLVGGIILLNYLNDDARAGSQPVPAAVDTIHDLAQTHADRMTAVADSGGPGLSATMLRLDVPLEQRWRDFYWTADGIPTCPKHVTELEPGTCTTLQDGAATRGETSQYLVETRGIVQADTGDMQHAIRLYVITFVDDDAAGAHFAGLPETIANGGGGSFVDEQPLDLGDDAMALSWETFDQQWHGREVTVLADNSIIRMQIIAQAGMGDDVTGDLMDLAELQLACLDGETSCAEPVPVPEHLIDPYGITTSTVGSP